MILACVESELDSFFIDLFLPAFYFFFSSRHCRFEKKGLKGCSFWAFLSITFINKQKVILRIDTVLSRNILRTNVNYRNHLSAPWGRQTLKSFWYTWYLFIFMLNSISWSTFVTQRFRAVHTTLRKVILVNWVETRQNWH